MIDEQAGLIAILGAAAPVHEPIAPEKVVEGAPTTQVINEYERGDHTYVGEWAATPGAWRVSYDEWEFCHMLSGVCELIPEGAAPLRRRRLFRDRARLCRGLASDRAHA